MHQAEARAQFAEQLQLAEDALELDRAALLIAAESYPAMEVEEYLEQLDDIAALVRANDEPQASPVTRILRMNDVLFDELEFHGNTENYFEARNSFLNEVIDRRTGIPITLSVVYLETARRIGLPLAGVGLPGHFIVKYQDTEDEIFIDPFNAGRLLTEQDCFTLVLQMYQGRMVFQREFLNAFTKRQILMRMLQNLKGIYDRARDHAKTLSVIERALLIEPSLTEQRDRGLVLASLGRIAPAIADLAAYLRNAPQAPEAKDIQRKLAELKLRQARLN
jgi:regulator of sirC expression with transglutaminase-like and TPR domain